ncbi:MAG: hypothetical protein A3E78_08440 [Alphaproteobacteria bacterium RIFCSPHIGHO2_12_FULL_63_12]|nr:MAG: hypothetical protein A3E78_08440 [Alphaproteobacteria bacterium RIFCSPHIGHO2_12_FULL_63_12]
MTVVIPRIWRVFLLEGNDPHDARETARAILDETLPLVRQMDKRGGDAATLDHLWDQVEHLCRAVVAARSPIDVAEAVADLRHLYDTSLDALTGAMRSGDHAIGVGIGHAAPRPSAARLGRIFGASRRMPSQEMISGGYVGQLVTQLLDMFKSVDETPMNSPDADVHPTWRQNVEREVARICGRDWKNVLDVKNEWRGAAEWLIRQLWDGLWGVDEAVGEIAFHFDVATDGTVNHLGFNDPFEPGGGFVAYPHARLVRGQVTVQGRYDYNTGAYAGDGIGGEIPRTVRPGGNTGHD